MQQNRCQKVFNKGLLRLCCGGLTLKKKIIILINRLSYFNLEGLVIFWGDEAQLSPPWWPDSYAGPISARNLWTNLIPNRSRRKKPILTCNSAAGNQKPPKQKDLSRADQRYVGSTAIKANSTDTRLDLLNVSWITIYFVCNGCRSTAFLTGTSNNQASSIKSGQSRI